MRAVVHDREIIALMSATGAGGQMAERAAGRVRDRAKRGATVDTGLMRDSLVAKVHSRNHKTVVWRIGSNLHYTKYQELGTPPIFARRAPLLTFKIGNKWISTYSTKGVPEARFLTKAIEAVTTEDFR